MRRKSPIAGQWYKSSEEGLNAQIKQCFQNSQFGPGKLPNELKSEPRSIDEERYIGCITPHAGLEYSGPIAANNYLSLSRYHNKIDTAIIIGPNHKGIGSSVSFYPTGIWEFPNGERKIDENMVEFVKSYEFKKISPLVDFDPIAHEEEHSIDIQVPFLNYLYNDFQIFPISLSDQSLDPVAYEIGSLINDIISEFNDKTIVILASTDLSHEYDYKRLEKNDKLIIEQIENLDLVEMDIVRKQHQITMCGYGSVYSLLAYVNSLENPSIKNLTYSNSGIITNSKSGYTVGYLSANIVAKTD